MANRNCPNCIYNYETKPSDSAGWIKVFCQSCGHWLDWNPASNCTNFIAKESAAHMNLDEAIAHYKAQSDNNCDAEQLVSGLTELKMLRKHTSLTEVERNAVNNYNLHHFKIVFALLKSMWADQNASNEEVRFPKLAERWKARAKNTANPQTICGTLKTGRILIHLGLPTCSSMSTMTGSKRRWTRPY